MVKCEVCRRCYLQPGFESPYQRPLFFNLLLVLDFLGPALAKTITAASLPCQRLQSGLFIPLTVHFSQLFSLYDCPSHHMHHELQTNFSLVEFLLPNSSLWSVQYISIPMLWSSYCLDAGFPNNFFFSKKKIGCGSDIVYRFFFRNNFKLFIFMAFVSLLVLRDQYMDWKVGLHIIDSLHSPKAHYFCTRLPLLL